MELGLIIVLAVAFISVLIIQHNKNIALDESIELLRKALSAKENELLDLIDEVEDSVSENKKLIEQVNAYGIDEFQKVDKDLSDIKRLISEQRESFVLKVEKLESRQGLDYAHLKDLLQKQNEALSSQILEQAKLIRLLNEQNKEFKRKLEIFTEIEADSKELNVHEDIQSQEDLIDQVLKALDTQNCKSPVTEVDSSSLESAELLTPNDVKPREHLAESLLVLDKEQKQAYELMENTNDNFFITGKAGTGKSFLLRLFVKATKKKVVKVSPTGVSALNIDGATIHKTFGFLNLEDISIEDLDENTLRLNDGKRFVLQHAETIIIDEISMVRADILDKIDKILRIVNKTNILFGGKQMIFFGDVFQLPPIANKEEECYLCDKYGGIFFFDADSYKKGNFHFIELVTNHRQKSDAKFFDILNRIREGKTCKQDIEQLNSRVCREADALRRIVRLYPRRAEVEAVNAQELNLIPAKEYSFNLIQTKNKYSDQNFILENYFPAVNTLKVKVGALVMMTRNDPGGRWVNGSLAIISKIKTEAIEMDYDGQVVNVTPIEVMINGKNYEILPTFWEIREAIYRNNRIDYDIIQKAWQYPMILAYAITIHKSQGMTYQKIACSPKDCFAPGQAYVALSRCVNLEGLYLLEEFDEYEIKVDSRVRDFYLSKKAKVELTTEKALKLLDKHKVEYIDETHQYFVDGVEVPSITTIVDTISAYYGWDDYSKVTYSVLKNAATKGQKLHSEIEQYELHGIKADSQEFENYLKIKELHNFQVLENEQIVVIFDERGKAVAAGRFDMVIDIDGKQGVLDIKRTSKMYLPKVTLQLNLYRIGYMQCQEKNIDCLKVLRLRKNVKQFKDIEINEESAWNYLYKYHQIMLERNRG